MVLGSSPVAITSPSDFVPASSKEFLDIQATIECGFTLKRVRDMTRTYSHSEIIFMKNLWIVYNSEEVHYLIKLKVLSKTNSYADIFKNFSNCFFVCNFSNCQKACIKIVAHPIYINPYFSYTHSVLSSARK